MAFKLKDKMAEIREGPRPFEKDEAAVNEQASNQITQFLKIDKLKAFDGLTTVEERIKFMYRNEAYWPLLHTIRKEAAKAEKLEKDSVVSRQMRDAGNTAFTCGDDQLALHCYNQALLSAPADPLDGQGEDMALALANRSALFIRQKKLEECLKDTTLALKCGYPKHLRYKLLQRHAKCLCDLNRFSEAKEHFKEAITFLAQSKLSKEQKRNVQNELQAALDALHIKDGVESALKHVIPEPEKNKDSDKVQSTVPIFDRNPQFPSLSSKVTIKYDSARGRHAVASEDIKCGSFIAHEVPIIQHLWGEHLLNHCSACLCPVINLVPCYTCSLAVFCSEECRVSAWNSYHQFECKTMEALNSVYSNVFFAYRAVAQKPLRFFLDQRSKFEKYDHHRAAGCYDYEYESDSESGETEPDSEDESYELPQAYDSSDYENLYNLLTHSDQHSEEDKMAYATSACLLTYYLKITNYFGSSASREADKELNDTEIYIAKLLHHFLEVTQFNSHEVAEASKWNPESGIETIPLGCGIYPTTALINHACCPNTTNANIGSSIVMMATKDIKKGQEITDGYTMMFQDKLMAHRQRFLLQRYKFVCNCTACTHRWPTYELLNKSVPKKGANSKSMHYIKKMYSTIVKLTAADLSVGHYDRVHAMWANYYRELEGILQQPNKSYINLASRLHDMLWLRWGSRGVGCQAPPYRDHRINQRRSSSNMNIPALMADEE